MQTTKIKERFLHFIGSLADVEFIDELLAGHADKALKRADYLYLGISCIIEQKSLETDTSSNWTKNVSRLATERGVTLKAHDTVRDIFSDQPDSDDIPFVLFEQLTRNIEQIVREANKQIRDTKTIFDLHTATGILVILNNANYAIDPELIAIRVKATLWTPRNDFPVYERINAVLTFQELHVLVDTTGSFSIPQPIVFGLDPERYLGTRDICDDLFEKWSIYNGRPVTSIAANSVPDGQWHIQKPK